jgi:hypothetical protein
MKLIQKLLIVAFATSVMASAAVAGCCDDAKKAGKECTHKCCVAAAKEKKSCEKCNPVKKDK